MLNPPAKRKGVINLQKWNFCEMEGQSKMMPPTPPSDAGIKLKVAAKPKPKVPVIKNLVTGGMSLYQSDKLSAPPSCAAFAAIEATIGI